MSLNQYFDNIYVLNLHKRTERMKLMDKRMKFCDIEYERFGATDGSVIHKLWECLGNKNFINPNYIGCAISHLSIYRDALEKGYDKILILEDDCRIYRNGSTLFDSTIKEVPLNWELLYLGFIPLSEDCSRWDYSLLNDNMITQNVSVAKNLWGLYSYGIKKEIMESILEIYNNDFPMELDRFFVKTIQPNGNSYAIVPQIFAADDGYSDNSGKNETFMLNRSIDTRKANLTDYI